MASHFTQRNGQALLRDVFLPLTVKVFLHHLMVHLIWCLTSMVLSLERVLLEQPEKAFDPLA